MPGYDAAFSQLRVAKAWGLSPAQWREQSADDRAMMIAFEGFEATRESYRQSWQEEQRERSDKKKAGSDGRSEFDQMKARMKLKR